MAQQKDLLTACRLYTNEGKNGKYMAGNLGSLRVFIFPIPKDQQKEANGATARLVFGERKFSEQDNKDYNKSNANRRPQQQRQAPPPQQTPPPIDDEDLPF